MAYAVPFLVGHSRVGEKYIKTTGSGFLRHLNAILPPLPDVVDPENFPQNIFSLTAVSVTLPKI